MWSAYTVGVGFGGGAPERFREIVHVGPSAGPVARRHAGAQQHDGLARCRVRKRQVVDERRQPAHGHRGLTLVEVRHRLGIEPNVRRANLIDLSAALAQLHAPERAAVGRIGRERRGLRRAAQTR